MSRFSRFVVVATVVISLGLFPVSAYASPTADPVRATVLTQIEGLVKHVLSWILLSPVALPAPSKDNNRPADEPIEPPNDIDGAVYVVDPAG